jgi:transposase-like protein
MVAVRLYLRYNLSYRDVEELRLERGVEVDHVTVFRWVHASPRYWPTRPGSAGTHPVTGGSRTRPM